MDKCGTVPTTGLSDKQSYSGTLVICFPGYCDRVPTDRVLVKIRRAHRVTLSTRKSFVWHV